MNTQAASIHELINSTLQDVRLSEDTDLPSVRSVRRISQVSRTSPAASAGLCRGDYLIQVNGKPSNSHHFWRDSLARDEMTYTVWSTEGDSIQEIQASPMPLGITAPKTSTGILAEYRAGVGQHEDLIDLWLEQDWDTLKAIGDRWKKPGWFAQEWQFRAKGRDPYSWQVESLFKGLAEFEVGDKELGIEIIENFAQHDAWAFEVIYHSMIWHHRAKRNWQNLRSEEAIDDLHQAHRCEPLPPVLETFTDFGLEVPSAVSPMIGEQFPLNYELPVLSDIAKLVSLEQVLAKLPENSMHLICVQTGNRSNKPYNRLMRRMQTFHRCLPGIFHSMHVLVGNNLPRGWETHETQARRANVPFNVLLDRMNSVAKVCEINRVPEVYGVDHTGKIVLHDPLFTEVALWDWLSGYLDDSATEID